MFFSFINSNLSNVFNIVWTTEALWALIWHQKKTFEVGKKAEVAKESFLKIWLLCCRGSLVVYKALKEIPWWSWPSWIWSRNMLEELRRRWALCTSDIISPKKQFPVVVITTETKWRKGERNLPKPEGTKKYQRFSLALILISFWALFLAKLIKNPHKRDFIYVKVLFRSSISAANGPFWTAQNQSLETNLTDPPSTFKTFHFTYLQFTVLLLFTFSFFQIS